MKILLHACRYAAAAGDLVVALGRHFWYQHRRLHRRTKPPLRIAIEASPAQLPTPSGMGRYISLLIEALLRIDCENEYTLLCTEGPRTPPTLGRARVRRLRFPTTLFERLAGPPAIEVAVGPVDVFHCQVGFTPHFRYGPLVVTVHDVIPLLLPEAFAPEYVAFLRRHLQELTGAAALIITGTHASAQSIREQVRVPPEKIRVVPHAADPRFWCSPSSVARAALRERWQLVGPYVLALGTVNVPKNHGRLVRAFAKIARDVPHVLLIAGRKDSGTEEVVRAIEETGIGHRVRLLGFVPDEDLPALVAEASLLVQPSLQEGFGLPVLDAMAAGTPVACSAVSALPEVAGEAAEYFDPLEVDSMAQALVRVLENPDRQEALRAAGLARARQFSWEETARRTLAVYLEAALRGGPS